MRFGRLVAGAALTFIVVSGCSSREDQPISERSLVQAIQGGTVDSTHKFAVGLCGGQKGYCQGVCSGALIAPNVVVTARHCVDSSPQTINCEQNPSFGNRKYGPGGSAPLWVTTLTNMLGSTAANSSTGWHSVKQIIVPTDNTVCGHDIALLVLNNVVAANEAVPIAPGVQYPMSDARYSSRFTAVGYGNTGPDDVARDAGTRRIRERIRVYCVPGDEFIDCPPEAKINDNEFVAGSGTCSGDSGSSAFEDSTFETPKSISFGVLSRGGVSQDGKTCEGSLYTRLDKYRDLVVQTVEKASNNWTLYPKPNPDWTVYVPPPVQDAGTDAKPTTKPSGLGTGEACEGDLDCTSKVCIDSGDGSRICSSRCTDSAECAEGYDCKEGYCLPATTALEVPAETKKTTTTSSCSISVDPQPTPWRWGPVGVAAALALAGAVRRRRR